MIMKTSNNNDLQHHTKERNQTTNQFPNIPYSDNEMNDNVHDAEARKRVKLPVLAYGYRTIPCGWDELLDIVVHNNDLAKLSRSEEQQYNYELYKQNLLLQWDTMTDYVLYTKFPNVFTKMKSTEVDASEPPARRWKVHPPIESISTTHVALVKNDFPYFLEENIEHWILWKLGGEAISGPSAHDPIHVVQPRLALS